MDLIQVKKIGKELNEAFLATCQNRSNYALEKLVIGEHETPERQYKQCLDELVRKVAEIGRMEIRIEDMKEKLEKYKASDKPKHQRKAKEMEINLWETNIALEGQLRECNTLYNAYSQMRKYTAEELQNAEEEYYKLRKFKQCQLELQQTGTIQPELINLLQMMGVIPNHFAKTFEHFIDRQKQEYLAAINHHELSEGAKK